MSLLPSEPDTSAVEESSPRVIGVDSDAADDLLSALSSDTAREILAALHDEPAPPSQLADRVDTSLQNVQYHLDNLAESGAVEVIDTAYSEKGREMDVYAPADRPLVIFAGEQSRTPSLRDALSRLLGGIGVLALASVVVQTLYGEWGNVGFSSGPPTGYEGDNATGGATTPTETVTEADAGDAFDPMTETTADQGGSPATDTPFDTATQTDTAVETATETPVETATQTQTETVVETATQTPTPTEIPTATETPTQTETAVETATETVDAVTTAAPDGGGGLPPGLLFFAGGVTALVVIVALWYAWR